MVALQMKHSAFPSLAVVFLLNQAPLLFWLPFFCCLSPPSHTHTPYFLKIFSRHSTQLSFRCSLLWLLVPSSPDFSAVLFRVPLYLLMQPSSKPPLFCSALKLSLVLSLSHTHPSSLFLAFSRCFFLAAPCRPFGSFPFAQFL